MLDGTIQPNAEDARTAFAELIQAGLAARTKLAEYDRRVQAASDRGAIDTFTAELLVGFEYSLRGRSHAVLPRLQAILDPAIEMDPVGRRARFEAAIEQLEEQSDHVLDSDNPVDARILWSLWRDARTDQPADAAIEGEPR